MSFFFFFFNDPATTEIYTLSLHDALPISRSRGVDVLLQAFETDILLTQVRDGGDELLECAPEPVQSPDDQRIPGSQVVHGFLQAGTLCLGTAHRIGEDLLTTCLLERVGLQIERLILGRDAGVTYQHMCPSPKTAPIARSFSVACVSSECRGRLCRARGSGGRHGRSRLPC